MPSLVGYLYYFIGIREYVLKLSLA
jgi:hypothetical protein